MVDNIYIAGFAKRLYELRAMKNISAREISLSLGKSPTFVHDIESAKNFPTMLNFFMLCEYLNITPAEFFDDKNKYPFLDSEIYEAIKSLDGKSKEYILAIVREINKKP